MTHNAQTDFDLKACVFSEDLDAFDLLYDDMDVSFGGAWGMVPFDQALRFLDQVEAYGLAHILLAIDVDERQNIGLLTQIIRQATYLDIDVLIIAEGLDDRFEQTLLNAGALKICQYPLRENALKRAISKPKSNVKQHQRDIITAPGFQTPGQLIAVQNIVGGSGASQLAVNLAIEYASLVTPKGQKVGLIDLDFRRRGASYYIGASPEITALDYLDALSYDDPERDRALFTQTIFGVEMLAAPELSPGMEPQIFSAVLRLIERALKRFDMLFIDLPPLTSPFSETVLEMSHCCYATSALDPRSAIAAQLFVDYLESEGMDASKLRFVSTDFQYAKGFLGSSRKAALPERFPKAHSIILPNAGAAIGDAAQKSFPMCRYAPRNPLSQSYKRLAASIETLAHLQ